MLVRAWLQVASWLVDVDLEVDGCNVIEGGFVENVTSHHVA
jgi:hypothetical protein